MSDQICEVHWKEAELGALSTPLQISITPEFVAEALRDYWLFFKDGIVGHKKIYLPLDRDPNGCREGVLVGYFGMYSGLKDIHFAPANALIGKPLCHIDILLRRRFIGDRLMSLDGVAISNGRTGWLALACLNLLLKGKDNIRVFLFGAGKIAQAVIRALNYGAAAKITHVVVFSQSKKSNHKLVKSLQPQVKLKLQAVDDRKLLRQAKFVITATTAGQPLFEMKEIASNAVTLPLGIDELPADYFNYLLKVNGLIVTDDMDAMEARNVDALALYYSRCEMKLTKHGRVNGVKNYAEVLHDKDLMEKLTSSNGPANFSAVGLVIYDLAVAAHVYDTLTAMLPLKNLPSCS